MVMLSPIRGLPAELRKNIKLNYYESGHMMYLRDEDRVLLHNNVAEFIERATNGATKP